MNPFEALAALGYARTVPIIPPTATISPKSSLAQRVGTSQDARGKTPGIRWPDGSWSGYDWLQHEADERDYRRWHAMGAGVGIRTGGATYLTAIDADTLDEAFAGQIRAEIEATFGPLPTRIGRAPKALYLLRTDGPVPYQRVDFGEPDSRGIPERVEVLSEGRQFVAQGIHPKTGQPYRWLAPLPPLDALPVVPAAAIAAFLERLREILPRATVKAGGTGTEVDQASLRGDPALIRKAVAAIPNTSALFPNREDYLALGYAIRAAVEDEAEAYEIWAEWCDRWDGGDNDPEIMQADWRRMKGPYRRGASWLYGLAENMGGGAFSQAEVHFDVLPESTNPFSETGLNAFIQPTDTFPVLRVGDIMHRPPAEWLVARHMPKHSVGFLYSEPGTGKSFLALDLALHIAARKREWHGDAIVLPEGAQVLYLAAEGSHGFRNRIAAWLQVHNLTEADLGGRFHMIEVPMSFLSGPDIEKLIRTLDLSIGPAVVLTVVDTVSRAMPGADENLQKDMTLFVRSCDRLRDATGGAVLGVHHAGKSGTMRGSTVLLGAGDFVFRLSRARGATLGTLACEKQKDGPDGWEDVYAFPKIGLNPFSDLDGASGVEMPAGESSLVVMREGGPIGAGGEVTKDAAARTLAAMQAAWDAGKAWGCSRQSRDRWAVRVMVAEFAWRAADAEAVLKMWESLGVIEAAEADTHSKRRGYRVRDGGSAGQAGDVFG
jgi:hypothetical protein